MANTIRKERYSVGLSLAGAMFAFPFLLVVVGMVVGVCLTGLLGGLFHCLAENVVIGAYTAITVVLAWILTRLANKKSRWETMENDGGCFGQCAYYLTGGTPRAATDAAER